MRCSCGNVKAMLFCHSESRATKNPKQLREYYVYILTNETHKLYVGVTGDLQRRMYQHKNKLYPCHCKQV